MEILVHHSIADLYKSLDLPFQQDTDFTIHFKPELFQQIPFQSPIYRADYFSFGFVKDGTGSYTIDEKKFSTCK